MVKGRVSLTQAARTIQRFFKENWTKRMMIKVIKMNLMLKRQEALAQKKKMKRLASKAMAANSLAKKDG